MKKLFAGLTSAAMALSMAACSSTSTADTSSDDSSLSGTVTVWASGEELTRFVEGFNELYPDITVEIEQIPSSDYETKLISTLSTGENVPDIFTGDANYVKYLVDAGVWDDLNSDTYDVGDKIDDVWDYIVSVGTDEDGVLRALSWQASPGTIFYRRDLAKEYLGTDDPLEISEMFATTENMLETAATLKENGIKILASWQDLMNMEFSNREEPWVVDGELVIDDNLLKYMDTAKTFVEEGYDLGVDPWDGDWYTAVESDDTFAYCLPSWGYQAIVKPQADKTYGQWGLAEAAVPYVKGGCWLGIYKDSENKEIAYKFLEYCCLNSEALQNYSSEYGEYVSFVSADEALAEQGGEEVLDGQNLYEFYNNEMAEIKTNLITEYDGTLDDLFLSATKLYANGTLTKDEAIEQFKKDVANAYPELTIN